jgi:hypothetical protein
MWRHVVASFCDLTKKIKMKKKTEKKQKGKKTMYYFDNTNLMI